VGGGVKRRIETHYSSDGTELSMARRKILSRGWSPVPSMPPLAVLGWSSGPVAFWLRLFFRPRGGAKKGRGRLPFSFPPSPCLVRLFPGRERPFGGQPSGPPLPPPLLFFSFFLALSLPPVERSARGETQFSDRSMDLFLPPLLVVLCFCFF